MAASSSAGHRRGAPFSRAEMEALLDLATAGIGQIVSAQKSALATR
jgi:ribonuclease PH